MGHSSSACDIHVAVVVHGNAAALVALAAAEQDRVGQRRAGWVELADEGVAPPPVRLDRARAGRKIERRRDPRDVDVSGMVGGNGITVVSPTAAEVRHILQ